MNRFERAIWLERKRCADHVRAMIGMLKRGAGQSEPWGRLEQALDAIERNVELGDVGRVMASLAHLPPEKVRAVHERACQRAAAAARLNARKPGEAGAPEDLALFSDMELLANGWRTEEATP